MRTRHRLYPLLTAAMLMLGGACEPPAASTVVWFTVSPEDSLAQVVVALEERNLIRSARGFRRYAMLGRTESGILPGTYPLPVGRPMGEVLSALRQGAPLRTRVDVRPGMMLSEIIPLLASRLGIEDSALEQAASSVDLMAKVGAEGETLEGYFFPTTYYVRNDATAEVVFEQAVDTFLARWDAEWDAVVTARGWTRHEAVIFASIVQGEGPHADEFDLVGAVYWNRLSQGMRLQADPTVVYALQRRRRLRNRDYQFESEFNTYLFSGLPPAPIGQPSVEALIGSLYPADVPHLYFVARGDGSHVFTDTYGDHLSMIREIRSGSRGAGVGNAK